MKQLKSFFTTVVLGGVTVILPGVLIVMVFKWLFQKISLAIQPISEIIIARRGASELVADIVVVAIILGLCFCVGLIERTRLGHYIFDSVDALLLKKIPGYTIIKETIVQLLGKNENPFSSVAIVKLFGSETRATAFVTDKHDDGSYTVFVPTGPNPTSGQIYHLKGDDVKIIDHPVDSTMRSIISCGAGSKELIEKSAK